MHRMALLMAALLLLVGVGQAAAQEPPQVSTYRDIAYADQSDAQKLDLYVPSTGDGPYPLVIFVHGGGWVMGDKNRLNSTIARQFVNEGYAVASVNYRLAPTDTYPAQVEDVKAAVRWLRANAETYTLDPDRFAAWGSSAGGHLVSMLGTTGDVAAFDNPDLGNAEVSSRVQAVINWFGLADLGTMGADFAASTVCDVERYDNSGSYAAIALFLGDAPDSVPDRVAAASPITYISEDDPPFLIQHGTDDCLVPVQQSEHLYTALVQVLGEENVQLTIFEGMGHGGPDFSTPDNFETMITFLDAVFAAPTVD